jgi:midasin
MEGEEQEEDAAAMGEEPEQKSQDQEQQLGSMAMQQMDENLPDSLKTKAEGDGAAPEEKADAFKKETVPGGIPSTNIANFNMASVDAAMPDDTAALEPMEVELEDARKRRPDSECREIWTWLEGCTTPLAAALCEQLRTILEPTLKGRLQGFYRTGKRISMRRVIPFIASNYRRDKIWLRRTKPSKREYQIIVALDNSRSMNECGVGPMALQTLCIVCQALAQLEVGEYAVLAFGSTTPRVLLPLGAGRPHTAAFGWEQARSLIAEFTFDEESADSHNRSLSDVMQKCSQLFDERSGSNPARPFCQVTLLISDGRFNKAKVRAWVHAALSQQQLPLLIIVDSNAEPVNSDKKAPSSRRSVFDLKAVSYEGGKCNVVPYLQDFPFPYYVVVQDFLAYLSNTCTSSKRKSFEFA